MKNRFYIFWILLGLFIAFRLLILSTSIDKLYNFEELYRGAIARDIIQGLSLPLFDYLYTDYEGGSLIEGILAVPFFLILGKTYFSLKLVAFSFSVLIFSLWYFFLNRFFGKTEAVLASLLMILSPPTYTKISLTSWGNHFESNLFTIILIYLFFKYFNNTTQRGNAIFENINNKNSYLLLTAGIVSGFGIFFSYSFLIPFVIIIFIWFVSDKKFFLRKSFFLFSSGILCGFAPGIYFNLTHNFVGLNVKGVPIYKILSLNQSAGENFFTRLYNLIVFHLPNSFCFSSIGPISGNTFNKLYYLTFIFSYFFLICHYRKIISDFFSCLFSLQKSGNKPQGISPVLFFIIFPMLFIIVSSIAPFKIGVKPNDYFWYRYFTPLIQTEIIIISVSLARIINFSDKVSLKKILSFSLSGLLITGLFFQNVNLISFRKTVNPFNYKGYNYFWLGQVVVYRYGFDCSKSFSVAEKLNSKYRPQYYEGLGYYYGWVFFSLDETAKKSLEKIDPSLQNCFYRGIGINFSLIGGENTSFETLRNFAEKNLPEYARGNFYVGFAKMMSYWDRDLINRFLNSAQDKTLLKYFYEGMGRGLAMKYGYNMYKCIEAIEKIESDKKTYYYKGFQEALRDAEFI